MEHDSSLFPLSSDLESLYAQMRSEYVITEDQYNESIKRGLRNADGTGVLVGVTRVGSVHGYMVEDGYRVPIPGKLYYRGIDVVDIVEAHKQQNSFGFEEVAYLLLMGKLPNEAEFSLFDTILSKARPLPQGFFEDMILKAPSQNIMNKLCRSVLALYSYVQNPEDNSMENVLRQSIELIARFPSIVANAYAVKRHVYDGKSLYIHNPKEKLSVAENFLRMVRSDKSYTDEEAKLLDLMLILHAEHGGGNNSAFICRALTSTGTDTFSAIAGAVGSLKGPLHGGANAKVMEMFNEIKENVRDYNDDEEVVSYLNKIMDGAAGDGSRKIYGLGHAVYTISDPRAVLLKKYAASMAEQKGMLAEFRLMESIERLGLPLIAKRKKIALPMCANVDMYSGLVYNMLGIPEDLFTPLFAIARITGWCAHRLEELITCNRIMRPGYRAAVKPRPYIPMNERP